MQLVYQLQGAGWADARIVHNSQYRDMSISYLSDALGDITHAALQLLRGARALSFSFADEPGEHRWILTRGDADTLRIRILWFEDTFNSHREGSGTEVFVCECAVLDFVGQVLHVLQNMLTDEGVEGYKRRWEKHEFPLEAFTQLKQLVSREGFSPST